MKITEQTFPILKCVEKNVLNDKIFEFIEKQVLDFEEEKEIVKNTKFFIRENLQINYICNSIHEKLNDTSNFIKAKHLLKNSPTMTGLLLLPKTLYPDFSNVPNYIDIENDEFPINAILFSWLSMDEHDKITGDFDENDSWNNKTDRNLLILPIFNDSTTQATRQYEMINNDDVYGWKYSESEGRAWYGKIHDYVMSFILFYNYTDSETKILNEISSGKQRRVKINDEKFINDSDNKIEIIDNTYFTNLIQTKEFGVSGHFKVQRYGENNSDSKIIFINDYKKKGIVRESKVDKKNSR